MLFLGEAHRCDLNFIFIISFSLGVDGVPWGGGHRFAKLDLACVFFTLTWGGGMLGPRSDMIINAESKVGR